MREDKTVDGPGSIGFSRRSLLSGAAAAGAAGTFGFSALMPADKALAEQVEALTAPERLNPTMRARNICFASAAH